MIPVPTQTKVWLAAGVTDSRECLAITVARRLQSDDVLATLTGLFAERGPPVHIRSDQGPEFIAHACTGCPRYDPRQRCRDKGGATERSRFIRRQKVTDAAAHDGARLRGGAAILISRR